MGENLPARLETLKKSLLTKENSHSIGAYWPAQLGVDPDKQGERILRLAFLAICNPKAVRLQECAPQSILHAIKEATELGLEIGGSRQHAALVPYKGECQFQPMYKGLIELAMRSGTVLNIEAGIIYEGDWIEYSRGFPPKFEHTPWLFRKDEMKPKERGDKILAAYALFWLKDAPLINGCSMPKIEVVEKWELDRISGKSKNTSSDSPWNNWPEEMMKKTAIKRGCKTLRLSTDLATAIEKDNEVEGVLDTDFTVVEEKKAGALTAGRHALPKKGTPTRENAPQEAGSSSSEPAETQPGQQNGSDAGAPPSARDMAIAAIDDLVESLTGTRHTAWKAALENSAVEEATWRATASDAQLSVLLLAARKIAKS